MVSTKKTFIYFYEFSPLYTWGNSIQFDGRAYFSNWLVDQPPSSLGCESLKAAFGGFTEGTAVWAMPAILDPFLGIEVVVKTEPFFGLWQEWWCFLATWAAVRSENHPTCIHMSQNMMGLGDRWKKWRQWFFVHFFQINQKAEAEVVVSTVCYLAQPTLMEECITIVAPCPGARLLIQQLWSPWWLDAWASHSTPQAIRTLRLMRLMSSVLNLGRFLPDSLWYKYICSVCISIFGFKLDIEHLNHTLAS